MARPKKDTGTYGGIRSRCGNCGNWATEGQPHTCPDGTETTKHTNPAAPPKGTW